MLVNGGTAGGVLKRAGKKDKGHIQCGRSRAEEKVLGKGGICGGGKQGKSFRKQGGERYSPKVLFERGGPRQIWGETPGLSSKRPLLWVLRRLNFDQEGNKEPRRRTCTNIYRNVSERRKSCPGKTESNKSWFGAVKVCEITDKEGHTGGMLGTKAANRVQ